MPEVLLSPVSEALKEVLFSLQNRYKIILASYCRREKSKISRKFNSQINLFNTVCLKRAKGTPQTMTPQTRIRSENQNTNLKTDYVQLSGIRWSTKSEPRKEEKLDCIFMKKQSNQPSLYHTADWRNKMANDKGCKGTTVLLSYPHLPLSQQEVVPWAWVSPQHSGLLIILTVSDTSWPFPHSFSLQ